MYLAPVPLRRPTLRVGVGSRCGMDFRDDRAPDYGDFAYVAFTIGMTFQVSDTDLVSRPIRMTASRHVRLSCLFGIAVIATTTNAVASA